MFGHVLTLINRHNVHDHLIHYKYLKRFDELIYRLENPLLPTATIIPGSLEQFEVIRKNVCLRDKTIILQILNSETDQLIKKDAHPQRGASGTIYFVYNDE